VLEEVRSAPAWWIGAGCAVAAVVLALILAIAGEGAAQVLLVVLLVALAVAVVDRPDGLGAAIYATAAAPAAVLVLVDWPTVLEVVAYCAAVLGLTWVVETVGTRAGATTRAGTERPPS
jgi:hypothetical protein